MKSERLRLNEKQIASLFEKAKKRYLDPFLDSQTAQLADNFLKRDNGWGMLSCAFFQRAVLTVAEDLIGKVLCSRIKGVLVKGVITETEGYSHLERGCHGYGGRKTGRNWSMFERGGVSYIYLCYGIHHLFNIVTGEKGVAEAVLIRSLEPLYGIEEMARRRCKKEQFDLTRGPGNLTKAMGISTAQNGYSLFGEEIWLEEGQPLESYRSTRIGIEYAGKDALLPWRFAAKNRRVTSR